MKSVLLSEVCNTIQCYNLEKTLKANCISHNEKETVTQIIMFCLIHNSNWNNCKIYTDLNETMLLLRSGEVYYNDCDNVVCSGYGLRTIMKH